MGDYQKAVKGIYLNNIYLSSDINFCIKSEFSLKLFSISCPMRLIDSMPVLFINNSTAGVLKLSDLNSLIPNNLFKCSITLKSSNELNKTS